MVAALIGHSLHEYSAGFKVQVHFTAKNVEGHYVALVKTLEDIRAEAPAYLDLLKTTLYQDMITAGPQVLPAQKYDYSRLNTFAINEQTRNSIPSSSFDAKSSEPSASGKNANVRSSGSSANANPTTEDLS